MPLPALDLGKRLLVNRVEYQALGRFWEGSYARFGIRGRVSTQFFPLFIILIAMGLCWGKQRERFPIQGVLLRALSLLAVIKLLTAPCLVNHSTLRLVSACDLLSESLVLLQTLIVILERKLLLTTWKLWLADIWLATRELMLSKTLGLVRAVGLLAMKGLLLAVRELLLDVWVMQSAHVLLPAPDLLRSTGQWVHT